MSSQIKVYAINRLWGYPLQPRRHSLWTDPYIHSCMYLIREAFWWLVFSLFLKGETSPCLCQRNIANIRKFVKQQQWKFNQRILKSDLIEMEKSSTRLKILPVLRSWFIFEKPLEKRQRRENERLLVRCRGCVISARKCSAETKFPTKFSAK